MTIDILGSGLSAISYDWNNKHIKWSVSSAYNDYKELVDLYFSLHKGQGICNTSVPEITLNTFPIKEIIEFTGSNYFTNSISYMIAYAIYTNASEINIYGVDMEVGSEYEYERPNVAFWLGFAKAKGIKTYNHNGFTNTSIPYGYDSDYKTELLNTLNNRMSNCNLMIEQKDGDERQQWIGAAYSLKLTIDLLKG